MTETALPNEGRLIYSRTYQLPAPPNYYAAEQQAILAVIAAMEQTGHTVEQEALVNALRNMELPPSPGGTVLFKHIAGLAAQYGVAYVWEEGDPRWLTVTITV